MSKANGSKRDTCLIKCRVEPGMFKSDSKEAKVTAPVDLAFGAGL